MCKKITAVEKTDSCTILVHTDCGTDSYKLIGWTSTSIKLSNDSGIKEIFWNQLDDPNFFNASDWVDNFKSCISFSEDEDNKVDNSYLTLCKDGVKVIFEVCKDSLGNKTYEGSDGSSYTSFADIISDGFAVECEEKVCICSEGTIVVDEGQTLTYADILADFNANSTFDDGTAGATGINSIEFSNTAKSSMDYTYNGKTHEGVIGQAHFGDGNSFNPVSTDLSITSNKGKVAVAYTVYKCN